MKIKETIGIDVSKLTIDVTVHSCQSYCKLDNTKKAFKKMVKWVYKESSFAAKNILFVFEHTGLYSHQLAVYLTKNEIPFILVPGLEIKKSLGITRGKDDKVDSKVIARYGFRLRDELEPYKMPSNKLMQIKSLLTLRERLVKQRSGHKSAFKEQSRILDKKQNKVLLNTCKRMITYCTKQIDIVAKEMEGIICDDDQLKELYHLIKTIKGVGSQTALFMIVYTHGFTKFKNSRKFASYCGIAPFPNSSGTSIRGRTKVSNLANKKIKSLLDLCAKVAIQHNMEMKTYYKNRVDKGKNKMSTINIIRNKLLARIFAVVERKTPYVDLMKYA